MQPIQRFYDSVRRVPGAVAATSTASGDITYADLGVRVAALASLFQDIDPLPNGRVGTCAWNTVDHLVAMLATYAAGKVWVPLNPRNARAALDAMIASTTPAIIMADASCVDRFTATSARVVVGSAEAAEWMGAEPVRRERDDKAPQIIKFSGGSTGEPKPVVQSRRCVNAQADGLRDFFEFQGDDVNLIAAPLTHGASCFVLPILETGGTHVMLDDPKPAAVFAAIAANGVTTMYAPPTLLYSLIDAPDARDATLTSLRHVIYSAAPMPPQRIRDCQRVLGPVIETAYGQVEAPQIVAAMRASELMLEENLTSVGRPSSVVTVGIMSADGALLGAGAVGEVVVCGPLVMTEYLDRPDDTARTIVDGWLHTGDLGAVDERGYLFIRGRLREVINTGGFKVYPAEVEACLARHPSVAECAVFGVEDERWGEAVTAAVVAANVTEGELITWVKSALGSVKAPKRIHFVEHLERNAAGKVSRAGVRASLSS